MAQDIEDLNFIFMVKPLLGPPKPSGPRAFLISMISSVRCPIFVVLSLDSHPSGWGQAYPTSRCAFPLPPEERTGAREKVSLLHLWTLPNSALLRRFGEARRSSTDRIQRGEEAEVLV